MINDMGWIPECIPNHGQTAMLRWRFHAAVLQFNLQDEVEAQRERIQAHMYIDPDHNIFGADVLRQQDLQPNLNLHAGAVPREGTADATADLPWIPGFSAGDTNTLGAVPELHPDLQELQAHLRTPELQAHLDYIYSSVTEAGAAPRDGTAETTLEQLEVRSSSSTEKVTSDEEA